MVKINSFVFFDLETTGFLLPGNPPKITELAFVAYLREHLLGAANNEIPRPVYKLVVPFNPMKEIHPDATRITGLDNLMLEICQPMNENSVNYMKSVFNLLDKPICLVAHYGDNFDYPVLKQHLNGLNSSFDDDIFCVDSIEIFKAIDGPAAAATRSYRLNTIYNRLYGRQPADAHNAEADAMLILKCAIPVKDAFVQRADSMAIRFNTQQ